MGGAIILRYISDGILIKIPGRTPRGISGGNPEIIPAEISGEIEYTLKYLRRTSHGVVTRKIKLSKKK